MSFIVIIPCRLNSTRLPEKALKLINGKTLIQRVFTQARQSRAEKVIVATDHKKIADHCDSIGAKFLMTNDEHVSGTDRIAECIKLLNLAEDQVIVNVQGDEPFINPQHINLVVETLIKAERYDEENQKEIPTEVSTLQISLSKQHIPILFDENDRNEVKIVTCNNWVRDFTREIPGIRSKEEQLGVHIGVYAYRAKYINRFTVTPKSLDEELENLEQLRLFNSSKDPFGPSNFISAPVDRKYRDLYVGVDTKEDLIRARKIAERNEN